MVISKSNWYISDWLEEIEMVLLSPRICHIVPGEENYMSILYDAPIFIKDCMVYFYDSYIEDITCDYSGTYFKALGIRWRYGIYDRERLFVLRNE